MNVPPRSCASRSSAGLVLGIGAILLGTVLLLEQIPGMRESRTLAFAKNLWPLILVGMGLANLRHAPPSRPFHGWFLMVIGGILLVVTLGHGRFDGLIAPVLVLCAGIFIVLRSLARKLETEPFPELDTAGSIVKGTAIMSGFKHRVPAQTFKGAELTAIFGGFELDLRQVVLEDPTARIDVFLLFGGGEIRVPENWDIVMQATAIAGGLGDKAAALPSAEPGRPQVVVTGLILFGGAEIKR